MRTYDDLGKLFLRISVAGLLLVHGLSKLQNGIGFVQNQVGEAGLPSFVAYGVYVGEIIAPVLVILGLFTRPAALIIAFDMVAAILLARRADIATIGPGGGWAIETEMLFLLGAIAIAALGAGRFALGKPDRWN